MSSASSRVSPSLLNSDSGSQPIVNWVGVDSLRLMGLPLSCLRASLEVQEKEKCSILCLALPCDVQSQCDMQVKYKQAAPLWKNEELQS